VWSVYNDDAKKIAMVAPMEDQFNVMFYGRKQRATDQWFNAKTFKVAVARIFKLDGVPRFDPPLPIIALGAVAGSESEEQERRASGRRVEAVAAEPKTPKADPFAAKASALIGKILRTCQTADARRETLNAFAAEATRLAQGGAPPGKSDRYAATAQALLAKILEACKSDDARAKTRDALGAEAKRSRALL
jgi:hypothetical protein